MLRFERILCPLDFSDFSAKAYDYARSLARHYQAKLFLEHVLQPLFSAYPLYAYPDIANNLYQDLRAHAEQQLREFLKGRAANGLELESVVCEGAVTDSILSFAEKHAVDLIVMGTHGRQGFDHLLLGSVTEKVLRKARCPVLAVPKPSHNFVAPENGADPVHLRKILFATDFSRHAERALDYALSLAQEYEAELTLLHVLEEIPPSWDLSTATADVVSRLEKHIPAEARSWCTLKSRLRVGRPYQEIVRFALETETDLVILGVRGRNALDLALFGSTTHRVIHQAPCPVLAVHI
jgi:nucleotide-binding universal stress UspA family protein